VTSAVRPAAIAWTVLVIATIVSWRIGADEGVTPNCLASAVVLVIAYLKVWLVGLHFMGLRDAPFALRAIFALWVVLSLGGLITIYLLVR